MHRALVRLLITTMVFAVIPTVSVADDDIWQQLATGGHIILMRHALAPGIGDPPEFQRDDCATQRNLSDQGRQDAIAMGDMFRQRKIPIDAVYSSHWCRCIDTGQLMSLGEVQTAPWLDSFFLPTERQARSTRTQQAMDFIQRWSGAGNLLLITHQVNITALVNRTIGSGDMVVVRQAANGLQVIGVITAPR